MVSEAEVWRTKSITAPSRPPESFTNCATSAVRSVNPPPGVWTVSSEVATVSALTADSAVRDSELGEVVVSLEVIFLPSLPRERLANKSSDVGSNLAGDILLQSICHLDQPAPSLLQKRHRTIHVAVARQRNLNFAFALGCLRFNLLQRVGLAGYSRLTGRQFRLELLVVGLQPADFSIQCRAFVWHRIANPARAGVAAGGNVAGLGIQSDHAVGDRR